MPLDHACFVRDGAAGLELAVCAGSGVAYPEHTHVSTHVFGLVRRGLLRLRLGGETRLLRAGDAFAVGPHQPHGLKSLAPYEMVSICVDKAMLDRADGRARLSGVGAGLDAFRRNGLLTAKEARAARKMIRAAQAGPAALPDADDPLEALKTLLQSDPGRRLSLDDMAARVHLDKYHLIRKFKKRFGLAPGHFQNQNRLRQAKHACLAGETPVQAALLAGFYDQSHFSRALKKNTGLTPRQFRAAYRRSAE